MTGEGLLVRPLPSDDLAPFDGSGRSLHDAEWCAVVRHLDGIGWEPSEDEHGDLAHAGWTLDGCPVVGLYGREPITSEPTVAAMAEAFADLCREAGVRLV